MEKRCDFLLLMALKKSWEKRGLLSLIWPSRLGFLQLATPWPSAGPTGWRNEWSSWSNSRRSRDQVQEPMAGLWAITLGIHRSPFQLSTAPRGRRGRGARRPRFSMVLWTEWPDVLDSRLLSSTLGKLRGARCCCWEACPHLPTPFPLIFSGEIWTISVDWEVLPSRSIFNSRAWTY